MTNAISPIRINHRGFTCNGSKRFVLVENRTQSDTFCVYIVDDVRHIKVLEGTLERHTEGESTYFVGDFSSITREGDYFVEAGGFRSRQFVIYDGAYDICERTMLEYFTYQRCGHPLGWNGACHLDDGFIKETGERVDLSGGYHQSCDLRKSPGGVSIGVLSMLRFAMHDKSPWGEILVRDEARWALEYFIKTIQENGAMYNTLSAPFGWEGREFYKSSAPSSAQWNVTSALALGYSFFKDTDTALAKKCLDSALRSYEFLTGNERPCGVYSHPDKFPLGMDPDFFYDQCVRGSVADTASHIVALCDLYRATGDTEHLDKVRALISHILCHLDGHILKRSTKNGACVSASCSYTWLMGGLLSLCDAYELLGDFDGLEDALRRALDDLCEHMDASVWKIPFILYSENDLDAPCGHENKTRRQALGALYSYKSYFYSARMAFEPSYACYMGVFLARGARLLKNDRYMAYAQAIADNLLGANSLDSSRVRAIGYNHATHISYGQFFPSTPFIPGAVGVSYHSLSPSESSSEYDMPCVGLSMYLLSEISRK